LVFILKNIYLHSNKKIVNIIYYFNAVAELVVTTKRKKDVNLNLNGGKIVLYLEDLMHVIKLHQKKGVQ